MLAGELVSGQDKEIGLRLGQALDPLDSVALPRHQVNVGKMKHSKGLESFAGSAAASRFPAESPVGFR